MKIKVILIIFPVLFFSTVTNAQKKLFSLGAGPTVGLPFNKNFKTPLGASIIAKYGMSKLGSLTGDITYLNTKSVNFSTPFSVSVINIKLGYSSYVNTSSNLFVQADAGLSIYKYSKSVDNKINFMVGLGLGYSFPLKNNTFIDLKPTINFVSNDLTISRIWGIVNLAYRFTIKANKD